MSGKNIKTKIICTIGPETESFEMIQSMAKKGMNIASKYGYDYWDGKRPYGYGGYKYIPGRWRGVAKRLIKNYSLNIGSEIQKDFLKILDSTNDEPIGDTYTTAPGSSKRYVKGNIFTNRAGRRPASKLSTKPLINAGTILLPIPVANGIKEFLTAWKNITFFSVNPLAKAVLT